MHVTLDPVHRKYCGDTVARRTRARPPLGNSSAPRPAETFAEFRETAMPMLLALGPYAYSDPVLLYKVVCGRVAKQANSPFLGEMERLESFLGEISFVK